MHGVMDIVYITDKDEWLKFHLSFEKDGRVSCEHGVEREVLDAFSKAMNPLIFINFCVMILVSRFIKGPFDFDSVRIVKNSVKVS